MHKAIVAASGLVDALAIQSIHQATEKDNVFPNITLYDFGVHVSRIHDLTSGVLETVAFAPLLTTDDETADTVSQWEAYAQNNQDWIASDLKLAGAVIEDPGLIPNNIVSADDDDNTMVLPIWQVGPTPLEASKSPVMTDLFGIDGFEDLFEAVRVSHKPIISPVMDVESSLVEYAGAEILLDQNDDNAESSDEDEEELEEDDVSSDEDEDNEEQNEHEPRSIIVEPVFASFDHGVDAKVDGVIIAVISWMDFFSGMLEDEAEGMVVDLENTCVQSRHSFLITDGKVPKYLGEGYVHDPRYAYMSQREAFGVGKGGDSDDSSSDDRRRLDETSSEEGHDDSSEDEGECGLFLSVHASPKFIENWQTNKAGLYTTLVVSVFFFTGLVFLLYDILVQVRQNKVMETAETTTAIVSSLFPAGFQERMMAEAKAKENAKSKGLPHTMAEYATNGDDDDQYDVSKTSTPLASLFPECTIMFA